MTTMRKKVPIDKIQPSPFQPRQTFDEEKLAELAQSIAEIDLLEPIILREIGEYENYELVAGERRLRACQQAGLTEVEVIIHEHLNDFEAMLISGSENLHREDLTSVERENMIYNLWKIGQEHESIKTHTDLARKLGMQPHSVNSIIRAKEYRESTLFGPDISTTSIIYTLSLPTEERKRILDRVATKEIAPTEIQNYVRTLKKSSESIRQALLKPGSRMTPEIAQQIDRKIRTDERKQQAIWQIEKQAFPSIDALEAIIEETREKERQQLELGHPPEEEVSHGRVSFQVYKHADLDGTQRWRVWKVGDGSIIEVFSATPDPKVATDIVCPHFMKLKWSLGCPYECAWCYLQGTLRHRPEKAQPTFKDRFKIARHLEAFLYYSDPEILNTGELSDSLMDEDQEEPFSHFIIDLIKKYRQSKPHKVLFLSKSSNVRHLLETEGQDVTICSFTVNAIPVARRWEKKAASVEKRLEAAKQLKNAGYEVRLRIDPIVPVEEWEIGYTELIDLIFKYLTPDRITLGSPRGLQSTINNARDKSWTEYLGERSNWGLKVPFKIRLAMYRAVIGRLKEKWDFIDIGLCKETLGMWAKLQMDYVHPKCNCIL